MEKRKAVIEKGATIKVNVGNYENLEIFQSIKAEIDFDSSSELEKKDAALTQRLIGLLKRTTEQTLKETKRTRVIDEAPAELW